MRVIENNICIKIIPRKFKDVATGYDWLTDNKRLSSTERYDLILRLVRVYFIKGDVRNIQFDLACDSIATNNQLTIKKVIKRSSNDDWRVATNGVDFRVPSELVSDCPVGFYVEKYEF